MTELARFLETLGYTLNTGVTFGGKKEGADLAFDRGAKKKNLFSPEVQGSRKREQDIAREIHPAPQYLKPGALQLMARNTNQVFGDKLDTPVDFVIFWAKETKGIRPEGGTGQAVEMARRKGIPTINLADSNWKEQLEKVLKNDISKDIDWREQLEKVLLRNRTNETDWKDVTDNPQYLDKAEYIYSQLGNKTISGNVVLSKTPWKSGIPNSIVAMRSDTNLYGNPFSPLSDTTQATNKVNTSKDAVIAFIEWLTTDKYTNVEPERRAKLLKQLKSGELKGKPIIYYKEANAPMHSTALDYLINKYDWSRPVEDKDWREEDNNCKIPF